MLVALNDSDGNLSTSAAVSRPLCLSNLFPDLDLEGQLADLALGVLTGGVVR